MNMIDEWDRCVIFFITSLLMSDQKLTNELQMIMQKRMREKNNNMVKGKLILATFPNCMLYKKVSKYVGSSWILQMHTLYICAVVSILDFWVAH